MQFIPALLRSPSGICFRADNRDRTGSIQDWKSCAPPLMRYLLVLGGIFTLLIGTRDAFVVTIGFEPMIS